MLLNLPDLDDQKIAIDAVVLAIEADGVELRTPCSAHTHVIGCAHLLKVLQVLLWAVVFRECVEVYVSQRLMRLQERDEREPLRLQKIVQEHADCAHLDVGHGAMLHLNVRAEHCKLTLATLRLLVRGRDDAKACPSLKCLQQTFASGRIGDITCSTKTCDTATSGDEYRPIVAFMCAAAGHMKRTRNARHEIWIVESDVTDLTGHLFYTLPDVAVYKAPCMTENCSLWQTHRSS